MQFHLKASHRINMVLFVALFFALVSQSAGQAYDSETEIYCDGGIVKIPEEMSNDYVGCCGKEVYSRESHLCCNGNILQIPDNDGHPSHPGDWECCGDNVQHWRTRARCCKDKYYNTSEQICNTETGELVAKEGNEDLGFCEGEVYNTSYQLCSNAGLRNQKDFICEKREASRFSTTYCCGSKSFSIHHELCCIDTIHPFYNTTNGKLVNQCCGRNVFPAPDYYRRRNYYIGKFACCGDVVIEKSSLTEQCCGSIRYNTTDSLCCEGVLVENVSFAHRCCGTSSYNTELSWCCNGNVYPLSFNPQSCHYNSEELKDSLNSEAERTEHDIWVYDRYPFESKPFFHRRSGPPGGPDY